MWYCIGGSILDYLSLAVSVMQPAYSVNSIHDVPDSFGHFQTVLYIFIWGDNSEDLTKSC